MCFVLKALHFVDFHYHIFTHFTEFSELMITVLSAFSLFGRVMHHVCECVCWLVFMGRSHRWACNRIATTERSNGIFSGSIRQLNMFPLESYILFSVLRCEWGTKSIKGYNACSMFVKSVRICFNIWRLTVKVFRATETEKKSNNFPEFVVIFVAKHRNTPRHPPIRDTLLTIANKSIPWMWQS